MNGSNGMNGIASNGLNVVLPATDLENVEAALALAREEIAALEQKVRLARGTQDMPPLAAPAPVVAASTIPVVAVPSLIQRIEAALRERVLSTVELAHDLGEPVGKVTFAVRGLRKNLGNVGTTTESRWTWRIGDGTPPAELEAVVLRLVSEQPLTTAELVAATGARASRVGGAMVAIQRSGVQVMNLGTQHRHRWFVVPASAKDVRLAPKRAR